MPGGSRKFYNLVAGVLKSIVVCVCLCEFFFVWWHETKVFLFCLNKLLY